MKRLLTICLVLLLCASVYATPVGQGDVAVSVAAVKVDTASLIQLAADQLGQINNAGNVFYADSNAGGSGTGVDWTNAVTTIKAAALKCASDNGDVLLVAPGHAETLTAADDVDITRTGLRIFGLGVGENRPTLTYTANGEFVFGADDVEIHGFNFIAGDAVVHAIDVEAGMENFIINDCRFWTTSVNTDEFIDCIDIAAGSDNGKITNCEFEIGAASAVSAISHVGSDFTEISGNLFSGDFSTAAIEDATTASIWMVIRDNTIIQGDTAGALNAVAAISLKADTSAVIINNEIFTGTTEALSIVSTVGLLSGNSFNATAGSVLEAGKTYAVQMSMPSATDDNLFLVAGGEILITSLTGYITTDIGAAAFDISIIMDHIDQDFEFTSNLDVQAGVDGGLIIFSTAQPAAPELLGIGANAGAGNPMAPWHSPAGMIELLDAGGGTTGAITWSMTFIPLAEGVTVTPQ